MRCERCGKREGLIEDDSGVTLCLDCAIDTIGPEIPEEDMWEMAETRGGFGA